MIGEPIGKHSTEDIFRITDLSYESHIELFADVLQLSLEFLCIVLELM